MDRKAVFELMRVGWFSGGCSSFIACYLGDCDKVIYIHVADQHPDTLRFLHDCERYLGRIEILQSDRFSCVDDVLALGYINGPAGAACSLQLKRRVRQEWERLNATEPLEYVWGFDATERRRAERVKAVEIEYKHVFPLIDRGLSKSDVHALCDRMGIERPAMYELGYPNNNCIGCVKGGMGYWNKIREDFPEVFQSRARRERALGHSCINGTFLDELEPGAGVNNPVVPACSLFCTMIERNTHER